MCNVKTQCKDFFKTFNKINKMLICEPRPNTRRKGTQCYKNGDGCENHTTSNVRRNPKTVRN